MITLGDVAQFQVGQVLELQGPVRRARYGCSAMARRVLMRARPVNGAYTLKIRGRDRQQQEFIDDLHSH